MNSSIYVSDAEKAIWLADKKAGIAFSQKKIPAFIHPDAGGGRCGIWLGHHAISK